MGEVVENALCEIKKYVPHALSSAFDKLGEIQKEAVLFNLDGDALALLVSEMEYEKIMEIVVMIDSMKIDISDETVESAFYELVRCLRDEETVELKSKKDKLLMDIYLHTSDRKKKKQLMEFFLDKKKDLAQRVKRTEISDDVIKESDNGSIQRLIREIDNSVLAVYLKYGDAALKRKFLINVSSRLKEMIIEDMEFIGEVKLEDVEEVRERIYRIYGKLVEAGEIIHPFSNIII